MHWEAKPGVFFSRLWRHLGAQFYVVGALLIVFSIPANLTALVDPERILSAFHIEPKAVEFWHRYIRIRALVACCVIASFAYALLSNRALHVMTYLVIGYLLLYLFIDIFTVLHFGQLSSMVWVLFSARLLVAVLVCISVEHYFDTQWQQSRLRLQTSRVN